MYSDCNAFAFVHLKLWLIDWLINGVTFCLQHVNFVFHCDYSVTWLSMIERELDRQENYMSQNLCHSHITVIAILLQWTHRNLYVCQVGIERLIVRLVTVSFTRVARSSRKIVILSVSLALVLKDSHWPWPRGKVRVNNTVLCSQATGRRPLYVDY